MDQHNFLGSIISSTVTQQIPKVLSLTLHINFVLAIVG